ncbi:uncharacterized protein LOC110442253 [Mizuhopecten yessoensis]|uniref:Otopetrin-2 n=1 Tax=Mizuhopecten yessoensis TaxID=6573 RepID=A0A210PHN0_MIZYE|nr:uncharacterized protein LOC110442253 [Mizuhopecten yessoensis]XP_021341434.1 uncharacterized protein LOC110442253 [Mizuhopecten yessoensis]OWF35990.1 hypothetical protein KP79_PYT17142 [Mizuhopecten yessoensis]
MSWSEILTLPFTAGNQYTSTNGRTHHDGSISTVVVVTSVLAFITVLMSLQENTPSGHVILDPMVMRLSLTVIVVAGICSTIYLAKLAKRQSPITACRKPSACFRLLQIGCLWLFGLGVVMICLFETTRLIFCDSEITRVLPSQELGVNIVYHVTRIVLVVIEVCFITCFTFVKFDHCLSTYYALLFIVLANTSVWIYYYLALEDVSSFRLLHNYNATAPPGNSTNKTCYQNSTIGLLTGQVNKILYPVNTEFSLLVLKFVLEMWSLERTEASNVNHITSVMGITETGSTDQPTSGEEQEHLNERSSLLNTNWEYRIHNSQEYTSLDNACPISFYVAIAVAISWVLPLAIMYIMLEYRFPDSHEFYRIIAAYEVAYRVVMTAAVTCTWVYLQKDGRPVTDHISLKSKDYILLLGTFGAAIYFIHVLIAGSLTKNNNGKTDIISNVISMVFLYLQTTLLLQTRKFVPKRKNIRNFPSFRSLCTVLSILNFGYWITDSFVGMKFPAASSPKVEAFGSKYWTLVMQYAFPLVIFYRLESGFAFLRLYGDFFGDDLIQ